MEYADDIYLRVERKSVGLRERKDLGGRDGKGMHFIGS